MGIMMPKKIQSNMCMGRLFRREGAHSEEAAYLEVPRQRPFLAVTVTAMLLLSAPAATAEAGDHAAKVEAFARIMAGIK